MSDIIPAIVCLIVSLVVGFVGGYSFGKTQAAKEFEKKAGKIEDVLKQQMLGKLLFWQAFDSIDLRDRWRLHEWIVFGAGG